MSDAFQVGTPFNPMRFREEIKNLELSMARLELLLKQYKTGFGLKDYHDLTEKIKEESDYLKNSWQDIERKLKDVEKTELPYYFIKEQTKRKINRLLEEVSELIMA